jgi:hypothetical protein
MGLCKYCEQDKPLVDAHIVPASFCREMLDPGEQFLLLVSKNPAEFIKRSPIGPYDQNILCRECEDRFQTLDDYGARLLIQGRDSEFRLHADGELPLYVADYFDYARLKLFVLSVLWRAAVSQHRFCSRVELGPRLARVRQMLEDSDPGSPSEFSTIFTRWTRTPQKGLPPKLLASPVRRRYEQARAIKLYLAHFVAEVCTSSAPFPSALSEFVISPSKPMVAIGLPLSGSGDVDVFKAALLKRGAMRERRQPK